MPISSGRKTDLRDSFTSELDPQATLSCSDRSMTPAESGVQHGTESPRTLTRMVLTTNKQSPQGDFELEDDLYVGSPVLNHYSQASADSHSAGSLDSINSGVSNLSTSHHHKKFRPKTLSIPGIGKISLSTKQQQNQLNHDFVPISGSLPTRKPKENRLGSSWANAGVNIMSSVHFKDTKGSSNGLVNFRGTYKSAPSTPLGGSGRSLAQLTNWTTSQDEIDFQNLLSGSISSIDEAQEAGTQAKDKHLLSPGRGTKTRSKSRLSLNIAEAQGRDNSSLSPSMAPSNAAKSQNIIPRFLRNSFSKLMNRDKKPNDEEPTLKASSPSSFKETQEFSSSLSKGIPKSKYDENDEGKGGSPEMGGYVAESPTLAKFYEESKLKGFPVIPFAFPTAVLAERMQNKYREALLKKKGQITRQKTPSGDSNKTIKSSSPKEIRHNSRRSNSIVCCDQDFGPKSLDNLVSIAQRELYSESLCGYSNMDEIIANSLGIKSPPPIRPRISRNNSLTDDEDFVEHVPPSKSPRNQEDDGYLAMYPNHNEYIEAFRSPFLPVATPSKAYLRQDSLDEHFPMDLSQS